MSLVEKMDADLKTAMKALDKTAVSTLRFIKSSIKNREIEKGGNLNDDEVVSVLSTLSKQRRESIEQFSKGGREDLVASEKAELEIIMKYLPGQLSEAELEKIIREVIEEAGASGSKDVGKVMKMVMPRVKGRSHRKA